MRPCRILLIGFALLWAVALFLLLVGTFGWFGQPQDPLSGVFLVLLAMPWALLPWPASPVVAALLPGLNLIAIAVLCRLARRRG